MEAHWCCGKWALSLYSCILLMGSFCMETRGHWDITAWISMEPKVDTLQSRCLLRRYQYLCAIGTSVGFSARIRSAFEMWLVVYDGRPWSNSARLGKSGSVQQLRSSEWKGKPYSSLRIVPLLSVIPILQHFHFCLNLTYSESIQIFCVISVKPAREVSAKEENCFLDLNLNKGARSPCIILFELHAKRYSS